MYSAAAQIDICAQFDQGCSATTAVSIDLRNKRITNITQEWFNVPATIEELDLAQNLITILENDVFFYTPDLIKLNLEETAVLEI